MKAVRRIYLIGFMGSGKTTTGKKLAAATGWSFKDLDREIATASGSTIKDIFAMRGEEHFRNIESDALRKLKADKNTVISTGGGTPCFSDNMDYMKKTGFIVYLRMTPEQLKSRLESSLKERPLIKELTSDDLLGFIVNKLAEREKWYNQADLTYNGLNVNIPDLKSVLSGLIVL